MTDIMIEDHLKGTFLQNQQQQQQQKPENRQKCSYCVLPLGGSYDIEPWRVFLFVLFRLFFSFSFTKTD